MKTAYTEMVALLKKEGFSEYCIDGLQKQSIEQDFKYPLTPYIICRIIEKYKYTRQWDSNGKFEHLFYKYNKMNNKHKPIYITSIKLKYINDR